MIVFFSKAPKAQLSKCEIVMHSMHLHLKISFLWLFIIFILYHLYVHVCFRRSCTCVCVCMSCMLETKRNCIEKHKRNERPVEGSMIKKETKEKQTVMSKTRSEKFLTTNRRREMNKRKRK